MANKSLKINVVAGRNLSGKNSGKSDPYCEIVLLDDVGNKIGKAKLTKVIKGDLNPSWNEMVEFSNVGATFTGMKLRCWDKHKFRSDKFLGQVTIKFNTALLSSSEKLDDWFALKKRKNGEDVSGDIHLQIVYGELKEAPSTTTTTSSTTTTTSTSTTKERSSTVVADVPNADLKVSASFSSEETNQKLKTSTHVVVDEEPDEDDGKTEGYEKTRDGPSDAALDKLLKDEKDLIFSNKNLELSSNSYDYYKLSWAKGNVRVNGGKWYFEVRLAYSGTMQIGWCTESYDPRNNSGDCWTCDGSRQQKLRNTTGSTYGEYWSSGDLIGVGLDVDSKSIQFWRNGKDLGVAFNDVNTNGGRLVPCIGLVKRVKVNVNFGKEPFAFPQNSFNMLHCFLSDKEIEQLAKLFTKYKEIGNKAVEADRQERESQGEKLPDFEPKDSIHGQGIVEFTKDIGVMDDEDPLLMIVAWKLKCETIWEISREEFMNGFTIVGCATIDKIKSKAKEWRNELHNDQTFKSWYFFVFDYLKEDKKILPLEEAVLAWKSVLRDRKWALMDTFVEFLRAEDKKAISRDTWQQLYHFMIAHPKTLKSYDAGASWPLLYDEFAEWIEKKEKAKN